MIAVAGVIVVAVAVAFVTVAGVVVVTVAVTFVAVAVTVARFLPRIRLARVGERRLISSQHALRGGLLVPRGVILGVRPTLSVCLHFGFSVPL